MDNKNKNNIQVKESPDLVSLYVKHKEFEMLLKRYENLNKQYIDAVYNKKSSKQEIDKINADLNTTNSNLINLSDQMKSLNDKLKTKSSVNINKVNEIENRIEKLMPILLKEQSRINRENRELMDAIGQEAERVRFQESSNLKYIFLFIFVLLILAALVHSLISPIETRVEKFIFSLIILVILYQIVIWISRKV